MVRIEQIGCGYDERETEESSFWLKDLEEWSCHLLR